MAEKFLLKTYTPPKVDDVEVRKILRIKAMRGAQGEHLVASCHRKFKQVPSTWTIRHEYCLRQAQILKPKTGKILNQKH